MVIEQLEREAGTVANRAHHALALLAGLAPDPRQWEYRGEMLEGDWQSKCVCGHPIKYLFPVYRLNECRHVGSVCVEHYASINPEMGALMLARLEQLKKEIAERKAQAKRAAQSAEAETLRAEFERIRGGYAARFEHLKADGLRAPYWLWHVMRGRGYVPSKAPQYVRVSDLIKWYRREIERLNNAPKWFNN